MNTAALKRAKTLIDLLVNEMDRAAPLHNAQAFLEVALAASEGRTVEVGEIQQKLGMSSAATSRALAAIGEWSYTNKPGLDLVRPKMDYTDRRRKPMTLTAKGEKLAERASLITE